MKYSSCDGTKRKKYQPIAADPRARAIRYGVIPRHEEALCREAFGRDVLVRASFFGFDSGAAEGFFCGVSSTLEPSND
jgi:hypothetical protein